MWPASSRRALLGLVAGLAHAADGCRWRAPFLLVWLLSPLSPPGSASRSRRAGGVSRRDRAAALRAGGAPDLALLRDVRRPGGQLAAAGQLPGRPEGRSRAPHLADQHRPGLLSTLAAHDLGYLGARASCSTRLDATLAASSAWSASAATSTTGTTPRRSQPLPPDLRLDGRQRQSGRPPAGAQAGLPEALRGARCSGRAPGRGARRRARPARVGDGSCGAGWPRPRRRAPAAERGSIGRWSVEASRGARSRGRPMATAQAATHLLERRCAPLAEARSSPMAAWRPARRRHGAPLATGARWGARRSGRAAERATWWRRRAAEPELADRRPRRERADTAAAPAAAELAGGSRQRRRGGRRWPGALSRADRPQRADAMAGGWTSGSSTTRERAALRHRLQRRRRPARHLLLRPAGLGGAAGELRRHRQGRRAASALVPPRARLDARRRRARAALLERHDVRVPDAAAGDAHLPAHAARRDVRGGGRGARSSTARSSGSRRGASPRRPTTRVDLALNYQYRAFGVPGLGLKRGLCGRSGRRALRHGAGALPIAPEAALRNLGGSQADRDCAADYGLYESIDYTPRASPQGARARRRSSAPTWCITRA